MATAIKYSRQRDAVITMLRNRYDHPTAEQLYSDLKLYLPKISLGTVYRNLSLLESMGELVRISAPGESDRFDGNIAEHYHFACEKCGSVTDIEIPVNSELDSLVESITNADVKRHTTVFYGVCENCKKKALTNQIVML